MLLEIVGAGGGLGAPRSLSSMKKNTSPLNFQYNELFSMFLLEQMAISEFLSDKFRENTRFGGYRPSDHFEPENEH